MHEVLVNRLGGLSLPRKSVVRLTDRPDMTLDFNVDVKQQHNKTNNKLLKIIRMPLIFEFILLLKRGLVSTKNYQ